VSVRFFTSPNDQPFSGVTPSRLRPWQVLLCAAALLLPCSARAAAPTSAPVAADSLAHFAPAGTAIFAEIRGLRQLEQEWSQSDWSTALSSIVMGRSDEPGSGTEALRPLARILGTNDPVAVRRELLGRHAAVVLPNWADLTHGVLLATPEQMAPIEAAMKDLNLKPEAFGQARQYQLDTHNHWLATDGHTLLLGRRLGGDSLYEQALNLLAGREKLSLADDVHFRENVAALQPGSPRGLIYFAATAPDPAAASSATKPTATAPATRPATTRPASTVPSSRIAAATSQPFKRVPERWWPASWPTLVRGAVGVTVDGGMISLGVRGQLDRGAPRHLRDANVAALNALPATTLAAWAQSINYPSYYRTLSEGSPTFLTLYLTWVDARMKVAGTSLEGGLLARLGQDTIVVLGVIPPAEQTIKTGFDIAALGLIVPVEQPAEVAKAMDVLGGAVVDIFNFPGIRAKIKEPLHVEKTSFAGTTISEARLGDFFQTQTACPYTHTLALSWAVTNHDLIVSTHSDHIRQILRARAGQAPRLGDRLATAGPLGGVPPGTDAVLLAQPAEITAMLDHWIAYLQQRNPEVLTAKWWEDRQRRQAARVSLGFGMAATRPTDVIVHSTVVGWPAHGRLLPGDRIIAADGTMLGTDNPRVHLKQLIANRKKTAEITLTVERQGKRVDVLLPLPDEPISFDPIAAVRQISALLKPFAAASYMVWCSAPNRFNARVMLRAAPRPATHPATIPATIPATASATTSRAATTAPSTSRPAPPPPPPPSLPRPTGPTTTTTITTSTRSTR
jgi:hypothetical protein